MYRLWSLDLRRLGVRAQGVDGRGQTEGFRSMNLNRKNPLLVKGTKGPKGGTRKWR
jgi:hypothetical protein